MVSICMHLLYSQNIATAAAAVALAVYLVGLGWVGLGSNTNARVDLYVCCIYHAYCVCRCFIYVSML